MTTRIISLTLAIVFLIGIVLGAVWAVWDATRPENQPLDLTKQDERESLDPEAVTLEDFEPLTEPLTDLSFVDVFPSDGPKIGIDDSITVTYLGALANDGEIVEAEEDLSIGLGFENANLLEGWVCGLSGMHIGSVRRLFIPAAMAYGSVGNLDLGIPADADMVYDFELTGRADGGVQSVEMIADFTPTDERVAELVIEDQAEGNCGREVKLSDTVSVHYTGAFISDGSVFDSSIPRGEPTTFPLNGVIVGWREGLVGMRVGGTRRLLIPAAKAYGEAGSPSELGQPPTIPPDSDLVFDVKLVEIVGAGERVN